MFAFGTSGDNLAVRLMIEARTNLFGTVANVVGKSKSEDDDEDEDESAKVMRGVRIKTPLTSRAEVVGAAGRGLAGGL
jgi:hypothetical protein